MKIAIVGCGKKKKERRHKAKNLYNSLYSKLRIRYAEQECDQYRILSAKHGLIKGNKMIEPYDKHIDEVDNLDQELSLGDSILDWKDFWHRENTEVFLLAGQKYVDVIEKRLPDFADVKKPFEQTSGIGEQIQWLKENIEDNQKNLAEVSK